MTDKTDFRLFGHNTFGMDVKCRRYIECDNLDELHAAVEREASASREAMEREAPLFILGGGSNVLFTKDYDGTILHPNFHGTETMIGGDSVFLTVGSGETWDDIVALAVENGWHGMENLSLIPGTVGASAVQNIGAYGVEAKDVIHSVECFNLITGETETISAADCGYGYRRSRFKTEWAGSRVITRVTYRLSKTFTPHLDYGNIRASLAEQGITEPTAADVRRTVIDIRRAKLPDPEVEGNAGSFFMNPVVSKPLADSLLAANPAMPHYPAPEDGVKLSAAWLIDQCGWKGRAMGRAAVHSRQPLVLVNKGGATGREVVTLCDTVRADVKARFGVDLKPEVIIL